MEKHLDDNAISRLVGHLASVSEAHAALVHLAVCPACHKRFLHQYPRKGREWLRGAVGEWRPEDVSIGLDELVNNLPAYFVALDEHRVDEVLDTADQVAELERLEPAHRRLIVRNSERFQTQALAEVLLEEAASFWHSAPKEAEERADLARLLLEQCCEEAVGEERRVLRSILARAWCSVGNAQRIQGKLVEASRSLREAESCLRDGRAVGDSETFYHRVRATLLRDQRRLSEASSAARRARISLGSSPSPTREAEITLLEASIDAEAGRFTRSVQRLRRGLGMWKPSVLGQRLRFCLLQNLAATLAQEERSREAARLIPALRDAAEKLDEAVTMARVLWVEGLVAQGLGDWEQASRCLWRASQMFLERSCPYDAAAVGLDLAAGYLQAEKVEEARELAEELVPIFKARGIHREATAAGLVVVEALRRETATVALTQKVRTFVRRVQRDASLRFEV